MPYLESSTHTASQLGIELEHDRSTSPVMNSQSRAFDGASAKQDDEKGPPRKPGPPGSPGWINDAPDGGTTAWLVILGN